MSKAAAFFIKFRPIPPIPSIPRTFPCGSWPSGGGGEPLHLPSRSANIAMYGQSPPFTNTGIEDSQVLNPLRAPKIKNIFVSAVASSTATGTLETRMPFSVQAWTSTWS